ncbi:MAG: hypothetical protein GY743_23335 [Planctomycetaceae bacterium]|nr:hypothetical protein [Planctomycetaceae bacterium]
MRPKVAVILKTTRNYVVPEIVKGEGELAFSHKVDDRALYRAIKMTENRLLSDGWGLKNGYKIVIKDRLGNKRVAKQYNAKTMAMVTDITL